MERDRTVIPRTTPRVRVTRKPSRLKVVVVIAEFICRLSTALVIDIEPHDELFDVVGRIPVRAENDEPALLQDPDRLPTPKTSPPRAHGRSCRTVPAPRTTSPARPAARSPSRNPGASRC